MKLIPELTQDGIDKFWDKVEAMGEDECWPWKRAIVDGYGVLRILNKNYRANRVALFLKTGEQKEVARHTCDNRICCNPKHLLWGSVEDNVKDRVTRGRTVTNPNLKGSDNGRSKLTEEEVMAIRSIFARGSRSRKELATIYGVSYGHIKDIINRHTWKHI